MLIGGSFILKEAKRVGFNEDQFLDICIITIIVGVIGARIYYVIFAWEYYKDDPLSAFNIRQGGLAIYGGVLAGIACIYVLSRIKKLSFLKVMDVSCAFNSWSIYVRYCSQDTIWLVVDYMLISVIMFGLLFKKM